MTNTLRADITRTRRRGWYVLVSMEGTIEDPPYNYASTTSPTLWAAKRAAERMIRQARKELDRRPTVITIREADL